MPIHFAPRDRLDTSTPQRPIRSILTALREAKEGNHVLWIAERSAKLFHEPGWVELQPHRRGAVLFVNRSGTSKNGHDATS